MKKTQMYAVFCILLCAACSLEGVIEPPAYSITYIANGGSGRMEMSTHVYGKEKELNPIGFTRPGYTFTGWSIADEGPVIFKDQQTVKNLVKSSGTTINLYAQWELIVAITYEVAYNANGGTGIMENSAHTANINKQLSVNMYIRDGYTFAGWAKTQAGPAEYTDKESVMNLASAQGSVITLYAQWAGITYYVAYNANGGSGTMVNSLHTYGTPQNLRVNTFSLSGYSFAGWSKTIDGPVMYTDGQSVNNLTTTSLSTITLYAQWGSVSASTYTVVYDRNGGTGTMENSMHIYGIAQTLSANVFTRSGFTFSGWAASSAGPMEYADQANVLNLTAVSGGTVILYAQWNLGSANTYTVVFDSNGGSGTMENGTHTYDIAKPLAVNLFMRMGYTFSGWGTDIFGPVVYTDQVNVLNLANTGGAVILYAQWIVNNYEVAYNANGGTGTMGNSAFTYGIAQELKPNTFTRTGYTFTGWAEKFGGPVLYADKESVSNLSAEADAVITVYAQWKGITYYVKYESNGGTGSMADSTYVYETAQQLKPNIFTLDGATFTGWATSAYGAVVYTDTESVNNLTVTLNATVTLYAKWEGSIIPVPGSGLAAKLAWLQSYAFSNAEYIVEADVNENIAPHILTYASRSNIIVRLKGVGGMRTINLNSNGAMFTVGSSVNLILDSNITLQGRSSNTTPLIIVNGGTLLMNGGEISGNTIFQLSISTDLEGFWGGGGVFVKNSGTFIMNSGKISNNTVNTSNSDGCGGGVCVIDGIFTMNSGEISGNSVNGNNANTALGGGVFLYARPGISVTFTMNGGSISGNTVIGTTSFGAGVYMEGHSSSNFQFSKTGGTIYGYTAGNSNSNTVRNNATTVANFRGHAVRACGKRKDSTAGSNVDLYSKHENNITTFSGGWDY